MGLGVWVKFSASATGLHRVFAPIKSILCLRKLPYVVSILFEGISCNIEVGRLTKLTISHDSACTVMIQP